MINILKLRPTKHYTKDQRGLLSIELALLLPIMFFWFAGTFVFFNAFHKWLKSVKANYTIADLISRQQYTTVDFVYSLDAVYDEISQTEDAANSYFELTIVEWDLSNPSDPQLVIRCSEATNTAKQEPTGIKAEDIEARIPTKVPDGDDLILLTSYTPYTPLFDWVGIPPTTFKNDMVAPLRFTDSLDIDVCTPPEAPEEDSEDFGDPNDSGGGGEPEEDGGDSD